MTSALVRLFVVSSTLSLTLISSAAAQQAGPRPTPFVGDSSCVQYRPTVQENQPAPRTTLPADTPDDKRYQRCLKRHHVGMTARDSSIARSPASWDRTTAHRNTTRRDTTMMRADTTSSKAAPPER